jgi:ribosomal protein S18 acetylase RimI-like enzyme
MVELIEMQENDILFISELLNEKEIINSLHIVASNYDNWLETYNNHWKNDIYEKHFIIHSNKNPVGWLKLNGFDSKEQAWISMLVVSSKSQRQGIGTSAIKFAEEYVRLKGFNKMGLWTQEDNIAAQALYKKCGYEVTFVKDDIHNDGIEGKSYRLEKILTMVV